MRLIAFTIELGEAPTDRQLSAVSAAATAPAVAVVVDGGSTAIIGQPDDVVAASVAAAYAARAAGADIRCRVEPLGEATVDAARDVAKAIKDGVAGVATASQPVPSALSESPTLDGSDAGPTADGDPLLSSGPLLDALSAAKPTPAGGSATAATCAMAAAIVAMATRVTLADDRYADAHPDMTANLEKAETLRDDLHALVRTDADAYGRFMQASALPHATEGEAQARAGLLQPAAMSACEVPLDVMRHGLSVLELCSRVARRGSRSTRPDVAVAASLAGAAVRGAWINVRTNLPSLRDMETRARLSGEAGTIARQAEETERHAIRAGEADAG